VAKSLFKMMSAMQLRIINLGDKQYTVYILMLQLISQHQ